LTVHESDSSVAYDIINIYKAKIHASNSQRSITIRPVGGRAVTLFFDRCFGDYRRWFLAVTEASKARFLDRYEVLVEPGEKCTQDSITLLRRRSDGWLFAVKVVDMNNAGDASLHCLEMELRVLLSIEQSNSVAIEEVYIVGGVAYIVTEYLGGGTLETWLKREGAADEETAQAVMRSLLKAISQLHDADIVHRNVRMENILLVTDDVTDGIKLAEFGHAAVIERPAEYGDNTAKNFALSGPYGAWDHFAPEILMKHPYGAPVDMWACGVCLHTLLTGELPPVHTNTMTDSRWARAKYSRSSNLRKRASRVLLSFLDGLLERDPVHRLTAWEALMHPWLHDTSLGGEHVPRMRFNEVNHNEPHHRNTGASSKFSLSRDILIPSKSFKHRQFALEAPPEDETDVLPSITEDAEVLAEQAVTSTSFGKYSRVRPGNIDTEMSSMCPKKWTAKWSEIARTILGKGRTRAIAT